MLDDVYLAAEGKIPVDFYGRMGGVVPFPDEILDEIHRVAEADSSKLNGNAREEWLARLEKMHEGK